MKKNKLKVFWIAIIGGFLFFSCTSEKAKKVLKIETTGLKKDSKKELVFYDYKMTPLANILLTEGTIEFPKTWEEPQIIYIVDKVAQERVAFLSESCEISLKLPFKEDKLNVEGITFDYAQKSKNLLEYQSYENKIKGLTTEEANLNKEWYALRDKYKNEKIPEAARAGIDSAFIKFFEDRKNYFKEYVTNNNNLVSQFIYLTDLQFTNTTESLKKLFNETPQELKQTVYYAALQEKYDILKNLEIGEIAPEIVHPDTLGNDLALSSLRGNYVLLDFWASWCGPCRKENPWVKKAYERFHNKGFDIYAVSLDYPGQKDKWLDAIHKDKLTWHHVSLLQGWKDPAVKLYNLSGIPSPFLLDPEGKIIAKGDNLREDRLIKILEEKLK